MAIKTMTAEQIKQLYMKKRIALRWRLIGANCHTALKALKYVDDVLEEKAKDDPSVLFRKDGTTPALMHQVRIASFALTLKGIDGHMLDQLICVILLHDVMEDFNVSRALINQMFGEEVYYAVWAMTKKFNGMIKSPESVFADISKNLLAALAKGCDRIDNFQSMHPVFTREKQLRYLEEGQTYFLPMLKEARETFTEFTDAFLNIETMLKNQIMLLEFINQKGETE